MSDRLDKCVFIWHPFFTDERCCIFSALGYVQNHVNKQVAMIGERGMRSVTGGLMALFRRNNKGLYLRRKSKVIIGRAFQKLDRSKFLGENVPWNVLTHFSKNGT